MIDDLMPVKYGLGAKGIARLFPFHVAFDKECNIVQAGAVRHCLLCLLTCLTPLTHSLTLACVRVR
jgi:hypothetical protein